MDKNADSYTNTAQKSVAGDLVYFLLMDIYKYIVLVWSKSYHLENHKQILFSKREAINRTSFSIINPKRSKSLVVYSTNS